MGAKRLLNRVRKVDGQTDKQTASDQRADTLKIQMYSTLQLALTKINNKGNGLAAQPYHK